MATITVDVNGTTHTVDVTLSSLTLRQGVAVEEAVGADAWDAFVSGSASMRPSLMRALLWAKLRDLIPDLTIDDFDLPIEDLIDALAEGASSGNVSAEN